MVVHLKKFLPWLPFITVFLAIFFFFLPFFTTDKIPVPADTIVGLYHPYRDLYVKDYPNGIPYKNFLITDPVRQTYIWKELAMDILTRGQLPTWNPYEMAGKPLLANFQTGAFYPLNIIFLIKPFYISWSLFIISQSILGALFTFLYLKSLRLNSYGIFIGVIAMIFAGFSVAWLEWGNVLHTAIWLPLILLATDKIMISKKRKALWSVLLLLSLVCSFHAGYLQIFFYLFVVSVLYAVIRIIFGKYKLKRSLPLIAVYLIFLIISLPQIISTFQFIFLSNRGEDQIWTQEGWFLPLQNLIQFIVPDFFGNPATLNYFGVWNYAEFVGYIGIGPLILALYATLFRRDKKTFFLILLLASSLVLATKNIISTLPFQLGIPFISSSQPTRLIFLADVALAILASLGFDHFVKVKSKIFIPILIVTIFIISLWGFAYFSNDIFQPEQIQIVRNNLKLPTLILIGVSFFLMIASRIKKKNIFHASMVVFSIIVIFDLVRFGMKFTPLVSHEYLYPSTRTIEFIKKDQGLFRVAVLDRRIMPPNFFTHYKIQTIEGYDPLYLRSYGEFVTLFEREDHDISSPLGLNRIITPHNYNSQLFDFLNVKYILSLDEIESDKLIKVFTEGQTKVYLNKSSFDRVFFVEKTELVSLDLSNIVGSDLRKTATIYNSAPPVFSLSKGKIIDMRYSENIIEFKTQNEGNGFVVISDTYYPTWKAYVDGVETKIYLTNHAFRGVVVPQGLHTVQFINSLY